MYIETENEAIVAVLIAAISIDGELSDFEINKVAQTLAYCRKFQNQELGETFKKTMILNREMGSVELIRAAVPFIEPSFLKTLYAMFCDLLCSDGDTSEMDIQLMALLAGYLELPESEYLPVASTFMARYLWNVKVN